MGAAAFGVGGMEGSTGSLQDPLFTAEGALQAGSRPVSSTFCWVLVYTNNIGPQACCKMFKPDTK